MKPVSFSVPQRAVHWLTAILVLYQLLFPGSIERVVDLLDDGKAPSASQSTSATIHIVIGFSILGLTILRLILRFVQGVPPTPAAEPPVFRLLSKIGHGLLYAILIIMPLAGISKYYFGNDFAGDLHGGILKLLLWALVVVHVAAVLVHKFYWKTDVLERMTRGA